MSKHVGIMPKQYDPKLVEGEVKRQWEENGTYDTVKKARSNGPKFYFLDGPPFPSSDTPHIGTCWNKVLKDAVIRYKRGQGFNVRDQPGYDCHGLPIELAIEQKFGVKTKKDILAFGVERFVSECKRFAEVNSQSMTLTFQDLGVWMEWRNPYMTHHDEYIESDWWSLKQAWSKGLFEHGQRVVHWCPRCETVLSDYEVEQEYKTLKDPSIYVKFPVEGREHESVLIWTTTPWTLPSNVGVMVNPDFQYSKVRLNQETFIIAKERVKDVERETNNIFEIIESFPGIKLEGLRYKSPLEMLVPAQRSLENAHRVVLCKEYVTLEEGTGCVHTAPGHGEEDYEIGMQNGLPVLMLVDDQGMFLEQAGKYSGKPVRAANQEIMDDLASSGMLLHSGEIEHRSPVCWRCRTPLLMRATDQWLIKVAHMKDRFIQEVDATLWIPNWAGASQFKNWLQNLKDWVVSRQRFWGTPLPVWVCETCKAHQVIGSKKELLANASSTMSVPSLHMPWVDAVKLRCKCGAMMTRIPDVMVGWYDSGAASYACLNHPKDANSTRFWWPADFIVEGRDQISGWFFSLLKAGLVAMDAPPYKTVLMHGFALDENGREMHKHLGNFVTAQEVVSRFGRDAFRYYVLQTTIWEDLKFSWNAVKQYAGDLSTFWNTFLFASTYMGLDKFSPARWPVSKLARSLRPEDRWLLSRLHRTIMETTSAMEEYKIHEAVRRLKEFLVEDISHTYIRFIRRRIWVETTTRDKLAAYATLYSALKNAVLMLSPLVPFLSESIYQHVFKHAEPRLPHSVHLLNWPSFEVKRIDQIMEAEMDAVRSILSAIALARMQNGLKQRQPIRKIAIKTDSKVATDAIATYAKLLVEQGNTHILTSISKKEAARYETEKDVGHYSRTDFPQGTVYLDLRLSKHELAEGLARDIVRRMQQMRKEMDLSVESCVQGFVVASSNETAALLRSKRGYVTREVRAKDLLITSKNSVDAKDTYYSKTWKVDENQYEIGLREVSVAKGRSRVAANRGSSKAGPL